MSEGSKAPRPVPTLALTVGRGGVVAAWAAAWHVLGRDTWGHAGQTFTLLTGLVIMVLAAPLLMAHLSTRGPTSRTAPRLGIAALLGAALWGGHGLTTQFSDAINDPALARTASDIAINTRLATDHLVAGRNPYAELAQVQHQLTENSPGAAQSGQFLTLWGQPYAHGYPYFPVMAAFYIPFRAVADGMHAIRAGNALLVALNLAGLVALLRITRRPKQPIAGDVAVGLAALLFGSVLPAEWAQLAVTDLLLSALGIWGWVAVGHKRPSTAGLLFGLAQGAKLLPGPFLLLPAVVLLWATPDLRRMLLAWAVTTVACVLPFLLWDAPHFLSATTLFYASAHAGGDNTALWAALPEIARTPFQLLGASIGAALAISLTRRRPDVRTGVAAAWIGWTCFVATNRMVHLNYLWAVHALGAVALLQALQPASRGIASANTAAD